MRIALPDGSDASVGQAGEILVAGPNVMQGYWNNPVATAEAIRGRWFHTGDIGRCDAAGNLYVVDRLKDMINTAGLKVYPAEVEAVLLQHPLVKEAGVFGVPDDIVGERVGARVVLEADAELSAAALANFCRSKLAPYKVPELVEFAPHLPRNATGKLLRRVLRDEALVPTS